MASMCFLPIRYQLAQCPLYQTSDTFLTDNTSFALDIKCERTVTQVHETMLNPGLQSTTDDAHTDR